MHDEFLFTMEKYKLVKINNVLNSITSFLSGNDLVLVRYLFSHDDKLSFFLDSGEVSDVAIRGMSPLTKPSSQMI